MARSTDTGHDINVTNFKSMITILRGYGAKYQPAKVSISITELDKTHAAAQAALDAVDTATLAYRQANGTRSDAFKSLSKQITRLFNLVRNSEAENSLIDSAKSLADKLRGSNVKPTETEAPLTPPAESSEDRKHSQSQLSYIKRLSNLKKFLEIVDQTNSYRASVEDLSKAHWDAFYKTLEEQNTAVNASFSNLSTVRSRRDKILYEMKVGLVDIALSSVKTELKGIFGASSNEYKQISSIPFTRKKL